MPCRRRWCRREQRRKIMRQSWEHSCWESTACGFSQTQQQTNAKNASLVIFSRKIRCLERNIRGVGKPLEINCFEMRLLFPMIGGIPIQFRTKVQNYHFRGEFHFFLDRFALRGFALATLVETFVTPEEIRSGATNFSSVASFFLARAFLA